VIFQRGKDSPYVGAGSGFREEGSEGEEGRGGGLAFRERRVCSEWEEKRIEGVSTCAALSLMGNKVLWCGLEEKDKEAKKKKTGSDFTLREPTEGTSYSGRKGRT